MKTILAYVLTILGSVALIVLIVIVNTFLGFELHSLMLWYIIPIGGFALASGIAWILIQVKRRLSIKIVKIDFITIIVLSLFMYIGVDFVTYNATFVSKDTEQISYFRQDSSDMVKLSELMDFATYVENTLSESEYQMHNAKKTVVHLGKTPTTIIFIVQLLGAVFGALIVLHDGLTLLYCDRDRVYFVQKKIRAFDIEFLPEILDFLEQHKTSQANVMPMVYDLLDDMESQKLNKSFGGKNGAVMKVEFCPKCFDGFLVLFKATRNRRSFEEVYRQKLPSDVVFEIVSRRV